MTVERSRAAALVAHVRPATARRIVRALVRQGEAAALLRLRGVLPDGVDLSDPDLREDLFDALELVLSPDGDPDTTDTEEIERSVA